MTLKEFCDHAGAMGAFRIPLSALTWQVKAICLDTGKALPRKVVMACRVNPERTETVYIADLEAA